jgi:membrane protein DedA with SNARE-associated domain
LFQQFTDLVANASEWAYAVVFLLALLDALVPVVPSETAVITAGVVAAGGDLHLGLVIAAGAAGAFLGDNLSYLIGNRFGRRFAERFLRSEKARKRMDWTEHQLETRGGEIIAVARFIPGGRTAVTLSAGTLGYPWPRFVFFDALAALIWATYAALLGYFGGHAFEEQPWKGLVIALATGFGIAGLVELIRWLRHRKRARPT